MGISAKGVRFSSIVFFMEVAFIIVMGFLAEYPEDSAYGIHDDHHGNDSHDGSHHSVNGVPNYPNFQDVNVMIFMGFGFLMTFLKCYGFSGVGMNMLLATVCIQWAFIVKGFIHADILGGDKFHIGIMDMVTSDFAAATVLISFGAVLGKASPTQLLIMGILEIVIAQLNHYVGVHKLHVRDLGESMFIHMFGAYFGLAVARVLYNEAIEKSKKEGSVYHSDVFAMIGCLFLWIFWPTFNGGFADDDQQKERAFINTFLSLCACTAMTFALSSLMDKEGRFDMVHIQNSTLAGGVAVGACANFPMEPFGAMLFGFAAATISVLGYKFLTPLLSKKLKIHDTCGVHNLHGMPGFLAAVGAAVLAAMSDDWSDHDRQAIFPETFDRDTMIKGARGRSGIEQGGYQMLAAAVTLGMAIGGGIFTGFILKLPIWDAPTETFEDAANWEVPEGAEHAENGKTNTYKVNSIDTPM